MELVIDDREKAIIPIIAALADEYHISYKIMRCSAGDYSIMFNGQILMIIERKTWVDLAASMLDGRKGNIAKLQAVRQTTGCSIAYLIEGNPCPHFNSKFHRIPLKALRSHLDHLAIRDGVHMIYSKDATYTAERLLELCVNMSTLDCIAKNGGSNLKWAYSEFLEGKTPVPIRTPNSEISNIKTAKKVPEEPKKIKFSIIKGKKIFISDGKVLNAKDDGKALNANNSEALDDNKALNANSVEELNAKQTIQILDEPTESELPNMEILNDMEILMNPIPLAKVPYHESMLRQIPQVGSAVSAVLASNGVRLKDLIDNTVSINDIAAYRYSTGAFIGLTRASKIVNSALKAFSGEKNKLQINALATIPLMSKQSAEIILDKFSFHQLMFSTSAEELAQLRRPTGKRLGEALADNILMYLR